MTLSVFRQHKGVSSGLTRQNKENLFFLFFDHFTYFSQYLRFWKRPNGPFTYRMPHIEKVLKTRRRIFFFFFLDWELCKFHGTALYSLATGMLIISPIRQINFAANF